MISNKSVLVLGLSAALIFSSCEEKTNNNSVETNTAPTASPEISGSVISSNAVDAQKDSLIYSWSIDDKVVSTDSTLDMNNLINITDTTKITLTVTDKEGLKVVKHISYTPKPIIQTPPKNYPPTAQPNIEGTSIISNAVDADNDNLKYLWLMDGSVISTATILDTTTLSVYGKKNISLIINDSAGHQVIFPIIYDFGPNPNTAPTAEPSISGAVIFANANDEQDSALIYSWEVNNIKVSSNEILDLTILNLYGEQTIVLTVTDPEGLFVTKEIPFNFGRPPNTAPTVNIEISGAFISSDVQYAQNDTLSYLWTVNDISVGNNETLPLFDINIYGTQIITLTVTDEFGVSESKSLIYDFGAAPNIKPSANPIIIGTTILANATDPDDEVLNYLWEIQGVQIGTSGTLDLAELTNLYGIETISLTVSDPSGGVFISHINYDFGPENTAPTATPFISGAIIFANAQDAQNDALFYTWVINEVNYGTNPFFDTNTTELSGNQQIELTVTDAKGLFIVVDIFYNFGNSTETNTQTLTETETYTETGTGTGTTTQTNTAPTINFQNVNSVLFANAFDAQNDTLSYQWEINDTTVSTESFLDLNSEIFDALMTTQNIVLTVTDSRGLSVVDIFTYNFATPVIDAIEAVSNYDGSIPLNQQMIGNIGASLQTADNPFDNAYFYINPDNLAKMDYSLELMLTENNHAMAEKIKYLQRQPSAIWLDSIEMISGSSDKGQRSLEAHLDAAISQQNYFAQIDSNNGADAISPMSVVLVLYNLPDRDCASYSSNRELFEIGLPDGSTLPGDLNGLYNYKVHYIGKIVEVLQSKVEYQNLRIVTILEPNSYPNMIINSNINPDGPAYVIPGFTTTDGIPYCDTLLNYTQVGLESDLGVYGAGIQIAINDLAHVGNVYQYIDIAHSAKLGWDNSLSEGTNLKRSVDGFLKLIDGANADGISGFDKVRGFSSNTSDYIPIEEPLISNLADDREALSDFYEWNQAVDEFTYIDAFNARIRNLKPTFDPGFIIDTSRNGWGSNNRPVVGQGFKGTDSSQRVDKRAHREHWCNPKNAGIGEAPKSSPDSSRPHLDAFYWVTLPGVSDGVSFDYASFTNAQINALDPIEYNVYDSATNPDYSLKALDPMCMPGESQFEPINVAPYLAPHAGEWFHYQFLNLIEHAYPALGESDYD
ncbi:glycoside hydrolase family 6 protein [Marinicellulosiphila megalodicopiae]|uniref:glycoside hydrolase family 6 protein n=1 Tax=Marinicellulosiphila megalodicopiae TaxID=2724896 RepID=UPI003BB1C5E6